MGYVCSFLGIAWEVFASRIWLVSLFVFLQAAMPEAERGWSPAVWATVVAFVGVPAAMGLGELAVRYDRRRLLIAASAASALLAMAAGLTLGVSYELTLVLCLLFGMTSYGRNAATTAGTIAVANPARRGATLAVQAFIGFSGGILGPLAFGVALDGAGRATEAGAWGAALCVMAVGPVLSLISLLLLPQSRRD